MKFSKANGKLEKLARAVDIPASAVYSFNIPAGHSCPFASDCFSKADRITGKILDGPAMKFRCYAASLEALYPSVRAMYWGNFEEVKRLAMAGDADLLAREILQALPQKARVIRVHTSGDFFNNTYFKAWLKVAQIAPNIRFYAYTKALQYWVDSRAEIPPNFILTASRGGKFDELIDRHNLPESVVVPSEEAATALGLEVDTDDSHAFAGGKSFALVIHGTQPRKEAK